MSENPQDRSASIRSLLNLSRLKSVFHSKSTNEDYTLLFYLLPTFFVLSVVLRFWLPFALAQGLAAFLVLLTIYPNQKIRKQYGFLSWVKRSAFYTLVVILIAFTAIRIFGSRVDF